MSQSLDSLVRPGNDHDDSTFGGGNGSGSAAADEIGGVPVTPGRVAQLKAGTPRKRRDSIAVRRHRMLTG